MINLNFLQHSNKLTYWKSSLLKVSQVKRNAINNASKNSFIYQYLFANIEVKVFSKTERLSCEILCPMITHIFLYLSFPLVSVPSSLFQNTPRALPEDIRGVDQPALRSLSIKNETIKESIAVVVDEETEKRNSRSHQCIQI